MVLIDRMINTTHFNTEDLTDEQLHKIEIKLGTIEDRIVMQMKNAIMDYVSEQMDVENSKKKPKPYYRKGRWE